MKSTVQKTVHAGAPIVPRRGPHLNALKHGLRSGSVLLPGDDIAAFRTVRARLFRLYRPRTVEEAQCVETIAAAHWRIARCRLEQSLFKQHLGAVMSGDPDATGYLCDPDPHRLHHRGTDCGLEEARLEKSMNRARFTLGLLQKQRTQNLTLEKSSALEDVEALLAEGEPVVEETASEAVTDTPVEGKAVAASGSTDREMGKIRKRNSPAAPLRFPKHWSRRQREAAARRVAESPADGA